MSELLEVVFEGVLKENVIPLYLSLIGNPDTIVGVQCSEQIPGLLDNEIDENDLEAALGFPRDFVMLVKLNYIDLNGLSLPKVLLRIVKYGEMYDIDFNFEFENLKNLDAATSFASLHVYCKKLAENFKVSKLFCGIEPASDEDTRYFTNDNIGPLIIT
jgi:hypothetical protein